MSVRGISIHVPGSSFRSSEKKSPFGASRITHALPGGAVPHTTKPRHAIPPTCLPALPCQAVPRLDLPCLTSPTTLPPTAPAAILQRAPRLRILRTTPATPHIQAAQVACLLYPIRYNEADEHHPQHRGVRRMACRPAGSKGSRQDPCPDWSR